MEDEIAKPLAAETVDDDSAAVPVTADAVAVTPEVRRRIFDVALRMFGDRGYAGTSVREIAEAAGVTKPMLYYYFGSKEDLFVQLTTELLSNFMTDLRARFGGAGTARERATSALTYAFGLVRERPEISRFAQMIGHDPSIPLDRDTIAEHLNERVAMFEAFFTRARDAGEIVIENPADAASILHGVMAVHLMRAACDTNLVLSDELAARLAGILFDGLAPREGTKT